MTISVRLYIFADAGLQRVSQRVMDGLAYGQDAMPQFAVTKQNIANVMVGLEEGKPARIIRADGSLERSKRIKSKSKVVDLSPKLKREKWERNNRIQPQPAVESNESFVGERAIAPRFSFLNVSEVSATPAARRSAKCTGCDGTGGSADKPAGSLLQPEFLLPKSLNPRLGRRVFYASRQCFVPGRERHKTPAGRNRFSTPAKTSGNQRWIPIWH